MNIVLAVFTAKAYKEYILPNIDNTNYEITLEKGIFQTSEDVTLQLDVIDRKWRVLAEEAYQILSNGNSYEYVEIEDGIKFDISTRDGVIVRITPSLSELNVFESRKYRINGHSVSIGSDEKNDIVCKASYISRTHAKITNQNGDWVIEDLSQNGVFLNSVRVHINAPLKYGDTINAIGLSIVFLGDIIAVSGKTKNNIEVNEKNLTPYQNKPDPEEAKGKKAERIKEYFNRAPRVLRDLYTAPFEIEPPPSPKPEQDKSMLATLGPSFTMAIPMMMGSFLMIASSRSSGTSASPMMFTGLITALTSAMLGVFWGIVNYRRAEKKSAAEEKHRFEAYSEYLMTTAEKIKEASRYNYEVMHEIYPDANVVVKYAKKDPKLWNRNYTHYDFLVHRVGIGDLPFQSEIQIPKERFSLIEDSLTTKPSFIQETYSVLKNVPVCLDIMSNKLIGVVGGKNKAGAYQVMKNLSAQIAACDCYTDVKLAYIFSDKKNKRDVEFCKWLPHCWAEDKKTRYCAFSEEETSDVCYELTKIFRLRDENSKDSMYSNKDVVPKPYYILFVEDAALLDGEPLAKYIFDCKECYGLTTILFAENYEDLPNSCQCIVYNDGTYTGIYSPNTLNTLGNLVTYDEIDNNTLEHFARTLSKVEVSEVITGGEIPNALTFLDMYHVDTVEELNVIERWKKNRTYENMRALIGQKAGGVDCFLDIHEKYHGPHGLVAGTTGSGKSETLQTYILSLALNYSPDDVGFLLVDFKGGGMANLFADLPHTLGRISNLSGAQVRRAMVSIKSENLRRQRVLSENGVNNINAYTRLLKNNEATVPMPHLFIIIDEFAELKREEPEFMAELISVAQVGRSLGVHLILATQKPGGVVDDNIRSNSKFKLCLRVQDKQDSSEMLGKPDAAYLSQAGRCYLQVGNDEIYELFQSGWSGATYDENGGGSNQNLVKLISSTGKTTLLGNKFSQKHKESIRQNWLSGFADCVKAAAEECGIDLNDLKKSFSGINQIIAKAFVLLEQMEYDFPNNSYNEKLLRNFITLLGKYGTGNVEACMIKAQEKNMALPEPKEKSQLDAVIDHIGGIAQKYGYQRGSALWLPMLPEQLYIDVVGDFSAAAFCRRDAWPEHEQWSLAVPIGLCDDPENQAQMPLIVDFAENGHLAVCGNVTSGKSTFLQSLFFALANLYSPQELNLYAIDFSNHMMQAFEKYPHTGAIMYENDMERIDKFFYMLGQMLAERKKAVGGGNFGQFINANGNVLPAVVIAIDNYSNFREKTDDKYEKIIWELSRDGAGFGIFLAISAGGFGSVEIQNKIGENIRNVFTLDLGDKMKYGEVLHVIHLDVVPTNNIKGRGLAVYADTILEYQTVLALEAADDYSRSEGIKAIGEKMAKAYQGAPARRVLEIPEKPTWTDFRTNDEYRLLLADAARVPFAYIQRTASLYSIDLRETFCYLIQGKTRTGRTDLLKVIAASAKEKGADICVVDFNGGQLQKFADKLGIRYVDSAKSLFEFSTEFTKTFKARNAIKRQMIDNGAEEDEIFERMSQEKPIFVFVSDFAAFLDVVYTHQEGCGLMNGFFENILERGRLHNIYFVFDLNMEKAGVLLGKKIYSIVTGYKCGVQLGGLAGQKVFDTSTIGFLEQNKTYRPGIGFGFHALGNEKIIIPSSKGIG